MKRRRPAYLAAARTDTLAVRTGEHCPESGWWFPAQRELGEAPSAARYISEGSVMPANSGVPALWLPGRTRSAAGKFEELTR
ncbi:hypothetical protein [Pseudarthrobacter sp. NS4]|uniref:hypothetical protein n=1 Tax=Pseudarthrobacter sp. NS4 TaxID=2973976 RepID=UPI00216223F0|nr:hypothetical protein [Pseudarthrobacter sp. NS4]